MKNVRSPRGGGIFLTHTVFSAPVCKRSRAVRLCVTLRYFFCKKTERI